MNSYLYIANAIIAVVASIAENVQRRSGVCLSVSCENNTDQGQVLRLRLATGLERMVTWSVWPRSIIEGSLSSCTYAVLVVYSLSVCASVGANSANSLLLVFHHPLTLSFIFCKSFPCHSLSFSSSGLTTWIPQTFTVPTSEHIRFYFLVFLFYTFQLLVPCGRLSWLMSAFERTLK